MRDVQLEYHHDFASLVNQDQINSILFINNGDENKTYFRDQVQPKLKVNRITKTGDAF